MNINEDYAVGFPLCTKEDNDALHHRLPISVMFEQDLCVCFGPGMSSRWDLTSGANNETNDV